MYALLGKVIGYSGILTLWRYLHRHSVTIVMVHGVMRHSERTSWKPLWKRMDTDSFERVMKQLDRHYNFVTLSEAVDMLSGNRPFRPYCLVVTFDDGYRNNYTHAWPILRKCHIPATFFISTGFVEGKRPYWVDRLDYALQKAPAKRRSFQFNSDEIELIGGSREQLVQSYQKLKLAIKSHFDRDNEMLAMIDKMNSSLERESGQSINDVLDSDPWAAVLNWDEINAACSSGVCIGSHSVDHLRLACIDDDEVERQIKNSKSTLEARLGTECEFFCYPNGSFTKKIQELVKKAKYRAALSTRKGLNKRGADLYALRRYPLPSDDDELKVLTTLSGLKETAFMRYLRGAKIE